MSSTRHNISNPSLLAAAINIYNTQANRAAKIPPKNTSCPAFRGAAAPVNTAGLVVFVKPEETVALASTIVVLEAPIEGAAELDRVLGARDVAEVYRDP